MIRIFIEPTDVLIFRIGLPFDAGANSYAPGIFPPSPEPLQGALREYLARALSGGRSLHDTFQAHKELLGDREQPGRFRMRGPFLARRAAGRADLIERLYRPPADLIGGPDGRPRLLAPARTVDATTDWPDGSPLWWLRGEGRPFKGWLTADELMLWQQGQNVAGIRGIHPDQLWQVEPRIGIKHRRDTRVVEEGFLYQMEFVRLHPGVGLDVEIWLEGDGPAYDLGALLPIGWGRLGGKGRTVTYSIVDPPQPPATPPAPYRRTRLYLATPTVLGGGWQPGAGDWSPFVGAAPLATAAIPGYVAIGGWSMNLENQDGSSKPMWRCVPAGSVYYFDGAVPWTDQDRLVADLNKRKIGYGVCVAGGWDHGPDTSVPLH